jgi:hypothetical protein
MSVLNDDTKENIEVKERGMDEYLPRLLWIKQSEIQSGDHMKSVTPALSYKVLLDCEIIG